MHFRDIIADSIYQRDWVTMIMVQNKYVFHEKLAHLDTVSPLERCDFTSSQQYNDNVL